MNPAKAPAIVADKMVSNVSPAAKPAAGANNVLTDAVRNTEKIFQNISLSLKFGVCSVELTSNLKLQTPNFIL